MMKDKLFIGIDPGVNGGIAFIQGNNVAVHKCPDTTHDMALALMSYISKAYKDNVVCMAAIEKVHSMPKQGVASTFKFGMNYGTWLGILSTAKVPYKKVTPLTWMKYFGTSRPKDKTKRKNHLKQIAQELCPEAKITLATADALLLAVWARAEHNRLLDGSSK